MSLIDHYLATVSPSQRAELERIRTIVKQLVPDAEETISYGMPSLKYKGKPLLYFAAFKDHMSLFPTSGPLAALEGKLDNFKVSKGTIQFTEDNPLPEPIIKAIITDRLASISKKS